MPVDFLSFYVLNEYPCLSATFCGWMDISFKFYMKGKGVKRPNHYHVSSSTHSCTIMKGPPRKKFLPRRSPASAVQITKKEAREGAANSRRRIRHLSDRRRPLCSAESKSRRQTRVRPLKEKARIISQPLIAQISKNARNKSRICHCPLLAPASL